MGKNPLLSKTLWTNVVGAAALLLQSEFGYLLPPQYQAIGLAVANLVLRQSTGQPLDWSKVKVTGLGMLLILVTAIGSLPLLSACSGLRLVEQQPVLTELTVRIAAGRVLDSHPDWVKPARDITADAIRLVSETDQVALIELEAYVLQRIPWQQLSLEETDLLRVLITAVRGEIETELARQGIGTPEEVRVTVGRVLGWIFQSAEMRLEAR